MTLDDKVNEFAAKSVDEILAYARENGIRGLDYRKLPNNSAHTECFMSRVLTHYTGQKIHVGMYLWGLPGDEPELRYKFADNSVVPNLIFEMCKKLVGNPSTFPEDLIERGEQA